MTEVSVEVREKVTFCDGHCDFGRVYLEVVVDGERLILDEAEYETTRSHKTYLGDYSEIGGYKGEDGEIVLFFVIDGAPQALQSTDAVSWASRSLSQVDRGRLSHEALVAAIAEVVSVERLAAAAAAREERPKVSFAERIRFVEEVSRKLPAMGEIRELSSLSGLDVAARAMQIIDSHCFDSNAFAYGECLGEANGIVGRIRANMPALRAASAEELVARIESGEFAEVQSGASGGAGPN